MLQYTTLFFIIYYLCKCLAPFNGVAIVAFFVRRKKLKIRVKNYIRKYDLSELLYAPKTQEEQEKEAETKNNT